MCDYQDFKRYLRGTARIPDNEIPFNIRRINKYLEFIQNKNF